MPTSFTFTREERLKSRKLIGQLFKAGNSFVAYPFRVVWVALPGAGGSGEDALRPVAEISAEGAAPAPASGGPGGAAIAISVPKKTFKTAVVRNRLKRRIREAYRLHKHELYEKLGEQHVALLLMFIAKEALPFAEIEAGVVKMVRKWPDLESKK